MAAEDAALESPEGRVTFFLVEVQFEIDLLL